MHPLSSEPEDKLKPYYLQTRDDLIKLIPEGAKRLLDVGCGGGMTGKALLEAGAEFVVGVERFEEAARQASKYYSEVIVGDVEETDLPFPDGFFDSIIYGDVLEHLIDPWNLLKKHRRLLKSKGTIVISIPNIRHYRVIKKLVFKGEWRYTDEGILDKTHLRFFTLGTTVEMLESAGYEVLKVVKRPKCAEWLRWLNALLGGILIDFLVKQYLILGIKRD